MDQQIEPRAVIARVAVPLPTKKPRHAQGRPPFTLAITEHDPARALGKSSTSRALNSNSMNDSSSPTLIFVEATERSA